MQHITSLSMNVSMPPEANVTPASVPQLAPYFQGVLMEHVDTEYASYLHSLPFNPYSQYCIYDSETQQIVWVINALTEEAAQYLIGPMKECDSLFLKKLNVELKVASGDIEKVSLKTITDLIANDSTQKSSIEFVTPTAFKSKGAYVFMPSVRLIFQNLLMRYGQVYGADKDVDPETISFIEDHVAITSYSIRSKYFDNASPEGRKIPAFIGTLILNARGPQQLIGLVRMLIKFAEYSGIGIKASMGMGGVQCK